MQKKRKKNGHDNNTILLSCNNYYYFHFVHIRNIYRVNSRVRPDERGIGLCGIIIT